MTKTIAIALLAFLTISAPMDAQAKKKKRAHKKSVAAAVSPSAPARNRTLKKPRDWSKDEYAKAQAQVEELRTAKDLPLATLTNQALDDEIPGQRSR